MTAYEIEQLQNLTKQELIAHIIQQAETIQKLASRIAALEKDSTNSSKPPGTDFHAHRTKSLRQKSGKPTGGQHGHNGIARMQVQNPDTVIACRPDHCTNCGNNLTGSKGTITAKRQKVDIPPIQATVTEYQQENVICDRCGNENKGMFPEHITAPFQIGQNLKAMVVYLNIAHHLPFERCTQVLKDLLSVRLSKGALDNALTHAYEKARDLYQEIMEEIKKEPWVGSDETGTKINGTTVWEWVWQSLRESYYAIERSRGYAVVEKHFGKDYYRYPRPRRLVCTEQYERRSTSALSSALPARTAVLC